MDRPVAVYQGGVLVQKVPGAKNGECGWVQLTQTVCGTCLEALQAIADFKKQEEEQADLPDEVVEDVIGRLKGAPTVP
jgi:hypothetical protein